MWAERSEGAPALKGSAAGCRIRMWGRETCFVRTVPEYGLDLHFFLPRQLGAHLVQRISAFTIIVRYFFRCQQAERVLPRRRMENHSHQFQRCHYSRI